LKISWPKSDEQKLIVSDKDSNAPFFEDIDNKFEYKALM